MGIGPHTELLQRLQQWYVGDYHSEEFYGLFNLDACEYVEFTYREMTEIFELEQMREWNAALNESKHQASENVITLVSFKPTASIIDDNKRRKTAYTKVHSMFKECFYDRDMNKINLCLKTIPMLAIFLSKKVRGN